MGSRGKIGPASVRAPLSAIPHPSLFRRRLFFSFLIALLLTAAPAVPPFVELSGADAATGGQLSYASSKQRDTQALPRKAGGVMTEFRSLRPVPAKASGQGYAIPITGAAPAAWRVQFLTIARQPSDIPVGPLPRPYDANAPP